MGEDGVHAAGMPAAPDTRNAAAPARVLVLGGARSGKSRYAQTLAERSGRRLVFIATAADYGDPEMTERIARHRADRDTRWAAVEAPLDLPDALRQQAAFDTVVLVDCLTLWLSNVMLADRDPDEAVAALLAALGATPGAVVLVSNEVGSGIVPDNALARRFRDAQGRLNAAAAERCDAAVLLLAGLPVRLKPLAEPELRLV